MKLWKKQEKQWQGTWLKNRQMNRAFIDSNIIIRLVIKDSPAQLIKSKEIIERIEGSKTQGILSILVVNEIVWILEHFYDLERNEFIPPLLSLLALKNIKILEVKKDVLINVLQKMQKSKIDLTDIYLAEVAAGSKIFSFDRDFKKL